ncbi:MAG: beta-carotene 15,15'-monooxygenase [Muricauda sp.]|nr:beta-carotene 15,15'-monooxygenase [Allomuricauda sp.]MAU15619.1 beta-carotene 15,15'-monooxygenase [Allomuricauda sp.]|tara:strand:- start:2261 stop:3526 length:1266 start_codon:yes stop_codon:yes gene_type:complete
MGLLKSIAQLKPTKKPEPLKAVKTIEDEKVTYHKDGLESSKSCQGQPENLKINLEAIYYKFENKCKVEELEQIRLKQPYITELKGKKTILLNKKEELEREKAKLEKIEDQIIGLKNDIVEVRRNPQKFGIPVDRRSSTKFWIGLVLLMFLTLYTFIFYISTSFSAFFRTFDPSTQLFSGMFYPRALQEAYDGGWLELGFILFIPFVFFGLGYLIHMFWHKPTTLNIIKVVMLFITTFIFDALLAYLIDEKLYNLNKTFEDPEFSVSLAFNSPSFWVIIFAGFVSYVIWGLVFDFVMKEHTDRDKIQNFINSLEKDINNLLGRAEKHKEAIASIEKVKDELKIRCTELENIIEGFILPIRNYKALSSEYLQGWLESITRHVVLGPEETKAYLHECRKVYDNHIKELDLDTDTYQNKVYTKTL